MSTRSNPRPDLRYPLVVNGLDYLLNAVDRLVTGPGKEPEAGALKYVVLHLQAGTEILLKARLQQEHWSLVFDEPATATRAAFDSADFTSCSTAAAFTRLSNIVGLDLPPKGIKAVTRLARDRNALMHYGLTQPAGAIESRAADVLNFLLPFLDAHLLPGLDPAHKAAAEQAMTVVRAQLRGIEGYIKTRMNDLRSALAQVADTTVVCPQCAQQALAVTAGAPPTCRFCLKTWPDPNEAATEYSWIVLGMAAEADPGPDNAVQCCPACSAPALAMHAVTAAVPDSTSMLCFSCAARYTDTDLAPCRCGCGRPARADAQEPLQDCVFEAFEILRTTVPEPVTRGPRPEDARARAAEPGQTPAPVTEVPSS